MSVWWALVWDQLVHAWRMRIPVALLCSVSLVVLAMPAILASDGSLEGKVKLFLLYGFYVQSFVLCCMAVGWTVWSERKERKKKINIMLHLTPAGTFTRLSAKASATLLLALVFGILSSLCLAFGTQWLLDREKNPEVKERVFRKLVEVRHNKALIAEKLDIDQVRIRAKKVHAQSMEVGKPLSFKLNVPKMAQDLKLEGKLFASGSGDKSLLQINLYHQGKKFWTRPLPIESGKAFSQILPANLAGISDIRLELVQYNKENTPFYYQPQHPLRASVPQGSLLSNLLRALFLFGLLCLTLICLALFLSQFMSVQGSVLVLACVYLAGFFKHDIASMLFPAKLDLPGVPQQEGSIVDIFYMIIWKPILWIVPEFSALDPTGRLVSGELITYGEISASVFALLPFFIIAAGLLALALPKQEVGAQT